MKKYHQFGHFLFLSYCISVFLVPGVFSQMGLTEADKMALLAAHNQARRAASPAASNMALMVCSYAIV
jgi:hypothetical protein